MPHYAKAISERSAAESKMGTGIAKLYDAYKPTDPLAYDVQGIATVSLSAEELKSYAEFFPNRLCNGITLHFYKAGHIKHPPLRYMINEKIESLCNAAKDEFDLDTETLNNIKDEIKDIVEKEFAALAKRIAAKREQLSETQMEKFAAKELHKLAKGTKKSKFQKLKGKLTKAPQEREHAGLMTICMGIATKKLREAYVQKQRKDKKPHVSLAVFIKKLRHTSEVNRSNSRDILTIDERHMNFSYDGLSYFPCGRQNPHEEFKEEKSLPSMRPVTAHNKTIGQRAANLSLVCEGRILPSSVTETMERKRAAGLPEAESKSVVTCSVVKHASIAPDNDLDWKESKLENLMYACNAAEDIMLAQAHLRQHGRVDESKKPIEVDWNYQLLTSNFWNESRQATNYGYAVRAIQCMSGATLYTSSHTPIHTNMHIFNAGINILGKVNFLWKVDTQRIENRKAYVHMTNALINHDGFHLISARIATLKKDLEIFKRTEFKTGLSASEIKLQNQLKLLNKVSVLKNLIIPKVKKEVKYLAEYHDIKKRLAENAVKFNELRHEFNDQYNDYKIKLAKLEKNIKQVKQEPSSPKRKTDLAALNEKLIEIKAQKSDLETRINACVSVSKKLHAELRENTRNLEKIRLAEWKENQPHVKKLIEELKDPSMQKAILAQPPEIMLSITALIYKNYMDDLYYSNKYRQREHAPLMNAYMTSYQHATGMMASGGCKSANDRAFIFRLFLAAVNGSPTPTLPVAYHENPAEHRKLIHDIGERVTSNAGMISCITDTAGGSPKVDSSWKRFNYFQPIRWFFDFISKFGKFAPHKLDEKRLKSAMNAADAYLKSDVPAAILSVPKTTGRSHSFFAEAAERKPSIDDAENELTTPLLGRHRSSSQ